MNSNVLAEYNLFIKSNDFWRAMFDSILLIKISLSSFCIKQHNDLLFIEHIFVIGVKRSLEMFSQLFPIKTSSIEGETKLRSAVIIALDLFSYFFHIKTAFIL